MKEYLKMADAFPHAKVGKSPVKPWGSGEYFVFYENQAEYAAHAINSHDELVELLQAHCKAQDDGANLVRELDVLLNGEDDAAIQAGLCDILAQVKKHGLSFNRVDELVAEVERLTKECNQLASQLFEADAMVQEMQGIIESQ